MVCMFCYLSLALSWTRGSSGHWSWGFKGGVGVQQAKPGLGRRSSGGWIVPVPSGKDSWSVEEGRLVRVKALNIEVWGRKHGPLDPVEPGGGVGGARRGA